MSRLPILKPRVVIGALERAGFNVVRVRGSHYQMVNRQNGRRVTVPRHGRDLTRATLASILNQAGVSVEDLLKLI